jgi:5-methylcytosine-specific restriction endonuclease McrA
MQVEELPRLENPRMHNRRVLVLDAAYRPVSIVPWEDAFTKLAEDSRAKVVEFSRDGAVIGVRRDIRVPAVIQLGSVVKPHRQRVRFCRKNVIVGRDHCVCQYCGERLFTEDLTLDHVVPRAQGGQTCWENVVACCVPCNQKKANRTPEQARMKLLRKPSKPTHVIEVKISMDADDVPEEWKPYWDVTLSR